MSAFPLLSDERIDWHFKNGGWSTSDLYYPVAHAIESESRAPLLAEIARLTEQVERLKADAERYRELRRQHEESDSALSLCVFKPVNGEWLDPVGCMAGELDAAIDAARA